MGDGNGEEETGVWLRQIGNKANTLGRARKMDGRAARASIMSDTSGGSYEFFLIAGPAVSITSHPLRPSTTHRSIHFGYEHRHLTTHTEPSERAPDNALLSSLFLPLSPFHEPLRLTDMPAACTYAPDIPAGLTPNLPTYGMPDPPFASFLDFNLRPVRPSETDTSGD